MEKILVTTDLSRNSIAGIYFGIQLSTQKRIELIFLYVNELWDNTKHRAPHDAHKLNRKKELIREKLERFIINAYKKLNIKPGKYSCAIHYHFGVVNSILDYSVHNNCQYICICTYGAGNVGKLFGTITGKLIKQSGIPVLCIPKNYKPAAINRLLYASDLANYESELTRVVAFGKLVAADIRMLHFTNRVVHNDDILDIERNLKKKLKYPVAVQFEKKVLYNGLVENLDKAVRKHSPSLLVMFTDQKRNFFKMLFFPSKSEKYTFHTKTPLLVFNKDQAIWQ